jgi:4a-hydroxytetrahydrobiopterin dehydratase
MSWQEKTGGKMAEDICELSSRRCVPCEGGTKPLGRDEIERLLKSLQGWESNGKEIFRSFEFKNFCQTMAFVNAVAWIANRQNHHPDLGVKYGSCTVRYSTHAIGGLSENDFICAAKIDAMAAE